METETYHTSLQWVGTMECPQCHRITWAWQSSGMSQCFPHFFCNKCSNVIHRTQDQRLVWEGKSQALLDQIAATLPDCPCGGRFTPGANPKCVHCGADFEHQNDPVERLHDERMIVVDGACVFDGEGDAYRVKIVGK